MTDLATRVETIVPLPPDLCAEVATVLGYVRAGSLSQERLDDWIHPRGDLSHARFLLPDFNSLDVVLRHTPAGLIWEIIQSVGGEHDCYAELARPGLPRTRELITSGTSRAEANARLAAIIREKVA